jgi:hypothetical protein
MLLWYNGSLFKMSAKKAVGCYAFITLILH